MRPFGLVELQSAGEGVEDRVGDAGQVSALEPGVVVGAHAGQHRDLLAAQPLDPPPAAEERHPRLFGGEPFPAGGEEVTDLVPVVHASTVRRRPPAREGLALPGKTVTASGQVIRFGGVGERNPHETALGGGRIREKESTCRHRTAASP